MVRRSRSRVKLISSSQHPVDGESKPLPGCHVEPAELHRETKGWVERKSGTLIGDGISDYANPSGSAIGADCPRHLASTGDEQPNLANFRSSERIGSASAFVFVARFLVDHYPISTHSEFG